MNSRNVAAILTGKWFGLCLTLFLSYLFINWFYQETLAFPNHYLISTTGDAVKNQYTLSYHVVHDTSFIHFQGMNYPYGDLVPFADAEFTLSNSLKVLSAVFPSINDNTVGIANAIRILSLPLCALFVYLILLHFRVRPLLAALGAFAIMVFQPQIFRFMGHYALLYAHLIPMAWFLLLKCFNSDKKWLWTVLFVISNTGWMFLHPYNGMFISFLIGGFWLFAIIAHPRKTGGDWKNWIHLILQAFMHIVLFMIFMKVFDFHVMREPTPWGFFVTRATLWSVFTPHHEPMLSIFNAFYNVMDPRSPYSYEGWNYVGITCDFLLLFILFRWIRYASRKNFRNILHSTIDEDMRFSLGAGALALIVAMGIPFIWGLEDLLQFTGPFRQFRAIGRFVWVFFYPMTVLAVYFMERVTRFLEIRKAVSAGYMIACCGLFFFFIEGLGYHIYLEDILLKDKNIFHPRFLKESYPDLAKATEEIDPAEYDAILPLPIFHIGSNTVGLEGSPKSQLYSMSMSFHTGLPLFSSMMARTSESEAGKFIDAFHHPYASAAIAEDIPEDARFLILDLYEPLHGYERVIRERAELIEYYPDFALYEISYHDLLIREPEKYIRKYQAQKDSLLHRGMYAFECPDSLFYLDRMENPSEDSVYLGDGALHQIMHGDLLLFDLERSGIKSDSGKMFELNFWYFYDNWELGLKVELVKEILKDGKVVYTEAVPEFLDRPEVKKPWRLVRVPFNLPAEDENLRFLLRPKMESDMTMKVDELIVVPQGCDFWRMDESDGKQVLYWNQHLIGPIGK